MKIKNITNITVTVTIPFFNSTGTIIFLNSLSNYGPGITKKIIGKSPLNIDIDFKFSEEYQSDDFISKLEKTFNPTFYSCKINKKQA